MDIHSEDKKIPMHISDSDEIFLKENADELLGAFENAFAYLGFNEPTEAALYYLCLIECHKHPALSTIAEHIKIIYNRGQIIKRRSKEEKVKGRWFSTLTLTNARVELIKFGIIAQIYFAANKPELQYNYEFLPIDPLTLFEIIKMDMLNYENKLDQKIIEYENLHKEKLDLEKHINKIDSNPSANVMEKDLREKYLNQCKQIEPNLIKGLPEYEKLKQIRKELPYYKKNNEKFNIRADKIKHFSNRFFKKKYDLEGQILQNNHLILAFDKKWAIYFLLMNKSFKNKNIDGKTSGKTKNNLFLLLSGLKKEDNRELNSIHDNPEPALYYKLLLEHNNIFALLDIHEEDIQHIEQKEMAEKLKACSNDSNLEIVYTKKTLKGTSRRVILEEVFALDVLKIYESNDIPGKNHEMLNKISYIGNFYSNENVDKIYNNFDHWWRFYNPSDKKVQHDLNQKQ